MRDPKTYRAQRRNEPGNFVRLSGDSFKKPFVDKSVYKTPSKKERYLERKPHMAGSRIERAKRDSAKRDAEKLAIDLPNAMAAD
jgi:hypothetical protein